MSRTKPEMYVGKPFCDPQEAERLAQSMTPYIYGKSRRLTNKWLKATPWRKPEMEAELVAAGMFGVAIALARFDPQHEKSAKFSTFAIIWIDGKMMQVLQRDLHRRKLGGPHVSLDAEHSDQFTATFHNLLCFDRDYDGEAQAWSEIIQWVPSGLRDIVHLRFVENWSYAEIARKYGLHSGRTTKTGADRVARLLETAYESIRHRLGE